MTANKGKSTILTDRHLFFQEHFVLVSGRRHVAETGDGTRTVVGRDALQTAAGARGIVGDGLARSRLEPFEEGKEAAVPFGSWIGASALFRCGLIHRNRLAHGRSFGERAPSACKGQKDGLISQVGGKVTVFGI